MIHWTLLAFDELTPRELYRILQLRNEVFVVEQQCLFQDADDKDPFAYHLMGWKEGNLVAYSRLLAPGISYTEMSIGRVVTAPGVRRTGIGRDLMARSIESGRHLFGPGPIRIGAQCYLIDFYSSLGFRTEGTPYLEDGIEHIEMVLP